MARPNSYSEVRRRMRDALAALSEMDQTTPCQLDPILYTDMRQSPKDAEIMCEGCPIISLCEEFGYTEGPAADGIVYGGKTWHRGRPVNPSRPPSLYQ